MKFPDGRKYTEGESSLLAKAADLAAVTAAALSAKICNGSGDRSRSTHIHMNVASGVLHGMAALIGSHPTITPNDDNFTPGDYVNPTSVLFAGLLLGVGIEFQPFNGDSTKTISDIRIGPEVLAEALTIVEGLGKPTDGYLDKQMLEAAREWRDEEARGAKLADNMLENLMANKGAS